MNVRLAIFNISDRRFGGVEVYLESVLPALARRGVKLAFLHENDQPQDRERLDFPDDTPCWSVSRLGLSRALGTLQAWKPDLIYAHGSSELAVEEAVLSVAPTVYFIHNYFGTCISGEKTHKFPRIKPCARLFGWKCLAHFYPHRCGGLNPGVAWTLFKHQRARLQHLKRCRLLLTHSEHMRQEYLRHGFAADRVIAFRYCVSAARVDLNHQTRSGPLSRLLFLGRMDPLKGGHVLLEALPEVCRRLQRPMAITFAGDGPVRQKWEGLARKVASREPRCSATFTGWVDAAGRERLLHESDLLILPSLWPEPFGQVGLEAGLFGVPAVAFDVGGVRAWLEPGVNGMLARGDPATSSGLAEAITHSLEPTTHARLSAGARRTSAQFGVEGHVDELLQRLAQARTQACG